MTTFIALACASGFSQAELATYLSVSSDKVQDWLSEKHEAPVDAVIALHKLVAAQHRAASEGAVLILARSQEPGAPQSIELGAAVDDHEARHLGWPTASAHLAVLGITIGMLPPKLVKRVLVVPRGSTLATAAAEI